jgi:AsmA protein
MLTAAARDAVLDEPSILYNVGMKRVVLFVGGFVVLVLAAALALPFIINPNDFRPLLETRLTQAMGRDVKLGNLKLSILGGSVEADDLSIAEDAAFGKTPFLKANSLSTQVELMPLIMSRQLNVKGIAIDQPEIILIQSAKGNWNISSLGGAATPKSNEPAPASGKKLDLVVHDLKITNGKLTLIELGQGTGMPRVFDQVGIDVTEFTPAAQFPFKFTAHMSGAGTMTMDGRVGPISDVDAALTPAQIHYKLIGTDIGGSHFFDASTGIRGLVSSEGDLTWNGTAFDAKGSVHADKLVLAKGGTPAQREVEFDFDISHDVIHHVGEIKRGTLRLGKAAANMTGTYSLKAAITSVILKLSGNKMPVDELVSFLPAVDVTLPNGSSLKGGTMTIEATSTGYLNNLTTKGSVDVEGTSLQNFDLGKKMHMVQELAGLKEGINTDFQRVAVTLAQTNEGSTLSAIEVTAPQIGDLTGGGTISAKKELALKMKIDLHSSGILTAVAGRTVNTGGIPFSVGGTVDNPQIHPDVGAVVNEVVKDVTKNAGKDAEKAGLGLLNNFLSGKKKPQDQK